jgi:hypothetical protein
MRHLFLEHPKCPIALCSLIFYDIWSFPVCLSFLLQHNRHTPLFLETIRKRTDDKYLYLNPNMNTSRQLAVGRTFATRRATMTTVNAPIEAMGK